MHFSVCTANLVTTSIHLTFTFHLLRVLVHYTGTIARDIRTSFLKTYILHIDGIMGPIHYFSALHQQDRGTHGTDA